MGDIECGIVNSNSIIWQAYIYGMLIYGSYLLKNKHNKRVSDRPSLKFEGLCIIQMTVKALQHQGRNLCFSVFLLLLFFLISEFVVNISQICKFGYCYRPFV